MTNSGKKQKGRPSLSDARENTTGIRLTKAERFIITQKARRTGMNLTTYIRQMAINGKVIGRFGDEDRQILRELSSDVQKRYSPDRNGGKRGRHFESHTPL